MKPFGCLNTTREISGNLFFIETALLDVIETPISKQKGMGTPDRFGMLAKACSMILVLLPVAWCQSKSQPINSQQNATLVSPNGYNETG